MATEGTFEVAPEFAPSVSVCEYSLTVEERNKREQFQQYLFELSTLDIEERLNDALNKGKLPETRFHVLGLNVWTDEDMTPAELTLVEFSLAQGITAVYHKKMKPVKMPVGFMADVKLISEKSHGMWLNNKDLSIDYAGILNTMSKMLGLRTAERPVKVNISVFASENGKYFETLDLIDEESERRQKITTLPVFVMPSEQMKITQAVQWLKDQAKSDVEFAFYPMDELFFRLMSKGSSSKTEALSMARQRLFADTLVYSSDLSCRFHCDLDRGHFCSLTCALRRALVIVDFGSRAFRLGMIDGKHVPSETIRFMLDDEACTDSNVHGMGLPCLVRKTRSAKHSFRQHMYESGQVKAALAPVAGSGAETSFSVTEESMFD